MEWNDWTDLIVHHTYISDHGIVRSCLIVTTAKLKNTEVLKVALEVPIDQSKLLCFVYYFSHIPLIKFMDLEDSTSVSMIQSHHIHYL